ncbi:MAG: hypothetical protein OXC30_03365 [Alphaproteobacteria bacterium]|nr:hypothetical protein [Alphaproteobacteria bacterium]
MKLLILLFLLCAQGYVDAADRLDERERYVDADARPFDDEERSEERRRSFDFKAGSSPDETGMSSRLQKKLLPELRKKTNLLDVTTPFADTKLLMQLAEPIHNLLNEAFKKENPRATMPTLRQPGHLPDKLNQARNFVDSNKIPLTNIDNLDLHTFLYAFWRLQQEYAEAYDGIWPAPSQKGKTLYIMPSEVEARIRMLQQSLLSALFYFCQGQNYSEKAMTQFSLYRRLLATPVENPFTRYQTTRPQNVPNGARDESLVFPLEVKVKRPVRSRPL